MQEQKGAEGIKLRSSSPPSPSGWKSGGRLALVEYRAEDDAVPIKPAHKMSEAQIRREVARHGLEWERTTTSLPWQHVVVFRKPQ
jgi:hypothetical protein